MPKRTRKTTRETASAGVVSGTLDEQLEGLRAAYPVTLQASRVLTGLLSVDVLCGGRDPNDPDGTADRLLGFPRGKFIEVFSPEGVGKTTVSLAIATALARNGLRTVFIDAEHSLDISLVYGVGGAEYLGNNLLTVLQASTFREVEHILDRILRVKDDTNSMALVIIDSITSVFPSEVFNPENSVEHIRPGIKAATESMFFPKYKMLAAAKGVSFLFLSQMRTHLDFMGGSTVEASGSKALRHYADIRISLAKGEWIKEGEQKIGTALKAQAYKNKMDAPFMTFPMHIIFGEGPSNKLTMAELLIDSKLVGIRGSWYDAPDGTACNGKAQLADWVATHMDEAFKILQEDGALL
jgi:recombination protein RecA